MDTNIAPSDGNDALDPQIAAILSQLWKAASEEGRPWSLARLGKRAQLPLSTLSRQLTRLEAAGLVEVSVDEEGRASAQLLGEGVALCAELFGVPAPP